MLSIKEILSNEGTVDRKNWWFWCILIPIILYFLQIVFSFLPSNNSFTDIIWFAYYGISLLEIIVIIVASAKRLRDTHTTGWLLILLIVPIINFIVLYYLTIKEGTISNKPNNKDREIPQLLKQKYKQCPYCAEDIKWEAIVCRYCGRDLPPQQIISKENENVKINLISTTHNNSSNKSITISYKYLLLLLIIPIVAIIFIINKYSPFDTGGCITTTTAEIYSGPGVSYKILKSAKMGECYKFDMRSNSVWFRISGDTEYRGYWIHLSSIDNNSELLKYPNRK